MLRLGRNYLKVGYYSKVYFNEAEFYSKRYAEITELAPEVVRELFQTSRKSKDNLNNGKEV